jgi:hypothetical protein
MAYYLFNGNANDESGNGNNGSVNGTQLTTDVFGNPNGVFLFNGKNDEIIVFDAPNLSFGTYSPQSISLWLYRVGTEPIMHFIGKRIQCGNGNYQFAFKHRISTTTSK